ncbi:MAG TPA: GNAT family protein [Solirubrobacterales bacterium]|jgi:RimJ/RimL family protein N-acetyltransferase|nr:GNAT family protein [Solirubrobacterales bacterium]
MRARPVTEADLGELARGFKVVVDERRWVAVQPPVTEAELTEGLRARLAEGRLMFALEDEDAEGGPVLVGNIDLHPTRVDGVWAFGMWVLPGLRGKGGGRMLLEAAIAARPARVHKIELEVWPHNEAAIALYERFGFGREGLRRDHYRRRDGRLHSSVIMARLFPEAF